MWYQVESYVRNLVQAVGRFDRQEWIFVFQIIFKKLMMVLELEWVRVWEARWEEVSAKV